MKDVYTLEDVIPKDKDLEIGRYFHLNDFLDMLFREKIKFTKISCFEDGQEGFLYNKDNIEGIEFSKRVVGDEYYRERIRNARYYRTAYYASCWVLKREESFLMWKSYANLYNGILLKTTIKSLTENVKEDNPPDDVVGFYFGKMDYGWKKKINSYHQLAFGKNEAFSEENEFRIAVRVHPAREEDEPIFFPINLSETIKQIVLSPYSNDAFKYFLRNILEKTGLDTDLIIDSEIKTTGEDGFNIFLNKFTK